MHRNIRLAGIITALWLAAGCNDSTNYDFNGSIDAAKADYARQVANDTAHAKALFAPGSGIIPSASDLLFTGSKDGTLNIPVKPDMSDGQKALVAQLNTLDGFSTTNPITTSFSAPIDEKTVIPGQTLFVFQLQTDANGRVTGIAKALNSPTELVARFVDTNHTKLALIPTAPLQPGTKYFVVLTTGIQSISGDPIVPDTTYALTKGDAELTGDFTALEPLRQATNALEGLAAAAGIDKTSIALSWTFTTQSIGKSLAALAGVNTASTIEAQKIGTTKTILDKENNNPLITGVADVYVGTIELPYYLQLPTTEAPTAPLGGSWRIDPATGLPAKTGDVTVPVLITAPNATSGQTAPADGWPVVVFQHGVTSNRTALFGVAETLAKAGFVAVAIDMPLHGIDAASPFAGSGLDQNDKERHFGLDLVNNDSGEKGPDGKIDDSGKYFINLESIVTARDNIRQSVADLMVLRDSLDSLDPVIPVDATKVRYLGHSFGAMAGTVYLAFEDEVGASVLSAPGGGIAHVVRASKSFGPIVDAGLQAKGIEPGSDAYQSFFGAAQWILDPADPINHGKTAAAKHNVLMFEIVGGAGAPSDQVVPNRVEGAPLAGTDPLAAVMGLQTITTSGANPAGLDAIVKFNAGGHSSLLRPEPLDNPVPQVTVEMQKQTATFLATGGTTVNITDGSVIAQ